MFAPPSITLKTISINDSLYSYSISQIDEEGISIKLESINNKNIYYLYKASKEQLIKEI